jgi:hypothetical protein
MSIADWNEGYIIEALDRLHIISSNLDEYLKDHPAIVKAEQRKNIKKALKLLMKAYQAVGSLDQEQ